MIRELVMSVLMNPAVQAIFLGFVLTAISWVVKNHTTEKTQRYWSAIRAAAISAFNVAESLTTDSENKTLAKVHKALAEFNDNIAYRFEREATEDEVNLAQDLWAELALELKKKLN